MNAVARLQKVRGAIMAEWSRDEGEMEANPDAFKDGELTGMRDSYGMAIQLIDLEIEEAKKDE